MNTSKKNIFYIKQIEQDLHELEIQINKSIQYLENSAYWEGFESHLIEEKIEHETRIRHQSNYLFKKIAFFLKLNNFEDELQEFKSKILSKKDDKEFLMGHEYIEEIDEVHGTLCGEIYSILFPIFEYYLSRPKESVSSEAVFHRKQLEKLLKSTGLIISRSKEFPKSEAQVYNIVKDHIKLLIPDLVDGKTVEFGHKLKTYVPDFSSELCQSVVEYKYIKSERDLKKTIDDLCADAKAYKRSDKYKYIFTVLYFTKYIKSDQEIEQYWGEKDFPDHWKYFVIIENTNQ